jgi:hypothetical protein
VCGQPARCLPLCLEIHLFGLLDTEHLTHWGLSDEMNTPWLPESVTVGPEALTLVSWLCLSLCSISPALPP